MFGNSFFIVNAVLEIEIYAAYSMRWEAELVLKLTNILPKAIETVTVASQLPADTNVEPMSPQFQLSLDRKLFWQSLGIMDSDGVGDGVGVVVELAVGVELGVIDIEELGLGDGLQKGHCTILDIAVSGGSDLPQRIQANLIFNDEISTMHNFLPALKHIWT